MEGRKRDTSPPNQEDVPKPKKTRNRGRDHRTKADGNTLPRTDSDEASNSLPSSNAQDASRKIRVPTLPVDLDSYPRSPLLELPVEIKRQLCKQVWRQTSFN
jgi:hypothetical protein